ncbi:DUF1329 domain-containing protein [Pseudomonas putida]|uniref:DUF1329 domain-containing protein n=1 Tax=Pseudomonas putida TaxID=303 RepID=UPI002365AC6B|nr:DUF1329 domain-containing protein [Pseudomonas putida]MDD2050608.1 DUF1329 domain-containing protein [Pseudomonas putida]
MNTIAIFQSGALALSLLAGSALAAVSPQEAAKLGTLLTPLGAEKAGNADGSIPAWNGGLKPGAAAAKNGFLENPLTNDKVLTVITAANVEQYKDKLSAGQLAMFKRYPSTYKIEVYPTRRTAAAPQNVYDAVKTSALHTESVNEGNGLKNFEQSHYYAFPIPKNGIEVVWNHLTRYKGPNYIQRQVQAAPQVDGSYTPVVIEMKLGSPWLMKDVDPQKSSNILYYITQTIVSPARLAGTVTLAHETLDQIKEPRMAWAYNAGQRRVRRAPQVAYDGPANAADGMQVVDQIDMYNGAPDLYDWKLIGKKEMYIPYNNYKLWSPKVTLDEIIKPGHINQDLARYELHRVWEVEATLKPSQRHIYAKRRMYFDEDTWQLALIDQYDGRGQLWRVSEGHAVNDYEQGKATYAATSVYDLIAGRYVVSNLQNASKQGTDYSYQPTMTDFTPAALRNSGVR